MPHHQNTSGFFITVIEKIGETGGEPVIAEEDLNGEFKDILQKDPRKRDFTFWRCDGKDPDLEYIMAFYGFTGLPAHQLIV